MRQITLPMNDNIVRSFSVGEPILLSGVMVTGRDVAHKWLIETFIKKTHQPEPDDLNVYSAIRLLLKGSVIYHCGPVVAGLDTKNYRFVAAGPTTSIREEPYQADVMRHFGIKGVMGKGGMGAKTLAACEEVPCVYLHAVGGAASLIAQTVVAVLGVYKLDFGVPEAMWVIEVKDFPAVVTMDAHGNSQHTVIEQQSRAALEELFSEP